MDDLKKRNINLMYIITFLNGLVFYAPVAVIYRQQKGLTMMEIFLLESILLILVLLLEMPWGYFADRFGYKITLVASFFVIFLSKIMFFMANSFYMFLLSTVLTSIGVSGVSGCDSALIYNCIEKENSEKIFGIYNAFNVAGFFLASLLYTVFIKVSVDFTVKITIIPFLFTFLLSLFLVEINNRENNDGALEKECFSKVLKSILNKKEIFLFVISFGIVGEVTHGILVYLNQLQYIKSGIDIGMFGLITALTQILCLLSVKTYKVTKRIGQSNTLIILILSITISIILLIFTTNPIISVLSIIVIEVAYAMACPINEDITNKSINIGNRATVLSIYSMISSFIGVAINIGIGKSADISLEFSLGISFVIMIIAIVMILIYFYLDKKFKKVMLKDTDL